jgi:hypothetical protein
MPHKVFRKVADALRASSMDYAENKARIAALSAEIHAIYFADRRYWQKSEGVARNARIEHQRRQERLEEIRNKLTRLRST